MKRFWGNHRGISVITVLFFIVILSVMGTTMASQAVRQNLVAANGIKGQQAYYAALSACDRASRDVITGAVTGDHNYSSFSIGSATIEELSIVSTSVSPPYILFGSPVSVWQIVARARVGDSYRQIVMYRAKATIGSNSYWPGVQLGGKAFLKNQVMFVVEDRNFR